MPDQDPEPTLTPQEQQVAAALAEGKPSSVALRSAGMRRTRTNRQRCWAGGDIHASVVRALNREGATLTKAARRVSESLDAMETKFFQDRGLVTDRRDVIAYSHRLDAAEQVFKLRGAYPRPPEQEVDEEKRPARVVAIQFNVIHKAADGSPPAPTNGKGITAGLVINVKPANGNGTNGAPHV